MNTATMNPTIVENLHATGRLAEKQMDLALEESELNARSSPMKC